MEHVAGVNTSKHAKHNEHLSTIQKFGGCTPEEELLRSPVTKTEHASHSCAAQEGGCTDHISDCT